MQDQQKPPEYWDDMQKNLNLRSIDLTNSLESKKQFQTLLNQASSSPLRMINPTNPSTRVSKQMLLEGKTLNTNSTRIAPLLNLTRILKTD